MNFRFESLSDFLYMEGHGVFVWSAYAISLVVLAWLVIAPLLQQRRLQLQLQRQFRREAARAESTAAEPTSRGS